MEQRSLRVVETNKTFFTKITSTLSKILIPTRIGINSVMISIKRSSLLKAYSNYQNPKEADNKEVLAQKYEDSYALYLEAIDKHIMDSVYKKVKNNSATDFEKNILSQYYFIVSLKDSHYLEYKYKKQIYLLKIDYDTLTMNKKENSIKKYKEFYISKMDTLYKGILKNYSVELSDNIKGDGQETYAKIFLTLEKYVTEILPIKLESDNSVELKDDYDNFEQSTIGKLDEKDKIEQKLILLAISRKLFVHSLPLLVTERCYISLLKEVRNLILDSKNDLKRDSNFELLYKVISEYNEKLLSTKIYWDNPEDKNNYKKFWEEYKKCENHIEKREVLFLKNDLKAINKNETKYKEIIKIYKEKLVNLGEMRNLGLNKNKQKTYTGKISLLKVRKGEE